MKLEGAIRTAVGFFLVILAGALLSALLGGVFGAVVAMISPDFVSAFSPLDGQEGVARYGFSIGMIWGLFIGAAVSGFACFLAAIIKVLKIHFEYRKDRAANKPSEATP